MAVPALKPILLHSGREAHAAFVDLHARLGTRFTPFMGFNTWDSMTRGERNRLIQRFQKSPRRWFVTQTRYDWLVWIKDERYAVEFMLRFETSIPNS